MCFDWWIVWEDWQVFDHLDHDELDLHVPLNDIYVVMHLTQTLTTSQREDVTWWKKDERMLIQRMNVWNDDITTSILDSWILSPHQDDLIQWIEWLIDEMSQMKHKTRNDKINVSHVNEKKPDKQRNENEKWLYWLNTSVSNYFWLHSVHLVRDRHFAGFEGVSTLIGTVFSYDMLFSRQYKISTLIWKWPAKFDVVRDSHQRCWLVINVIDLVRGYIPRKPHLVRHRYLTFLYHFRPSFS